MGDSPPVIWAIADGRPGHWNQVRGIVEAIERRMLINDYAITAPSRLQSVIDAASGRWSATSELPSPDLILGAGHATHLPMLLARRSRGGRCVVIMRPTFPTHWFDLCLLPDIHRCAPGPHIMLTRGAVNRIKRSDQADPDAGLILVGGPSRHVRWDGASVAEQIFQVCSAMGDTHWTISTSRRTPQEMLYLLQNMGLLNTTIVDGCSTSSNWLPAQLSRSAVAWVTADSVSMVYEALTSGARVGVLKVPLRRSTGKLARSLDSLSAAGDVTLFEDWTRSGQILSSTSVFAEADRCAAEIVRRFLRPPLARAA